MEHYVLFVSLIVKFAQSQYYFQNAEDREICDNGDFVDISPYRKVSLVQMSWQSAHACCKMKGSLLHTIEKSVESEQYPLQDVLYDALRMEAENLQFWIGLSFHKDRFQWSFGSEFPQGYQTIFREKYRWTYGHPELPHKMHCVAISPYRGILEMRTAVCSQKLNFICQKVQRIGGEPLSALDMMVVGSAKFIDVPDFANLKFGSDFTRWPVAKAICQSRGWSLIDRVHERYGDDLAKVIKNSRYMFNKSSRALHTSGNDFCETQKIWTWACGERLVGDIPWFPNITVEQQEASLNNEHCLQYIVQPIKSNSSYSTLMANIVGCDEFGYTICDTTPSCSVNDQYRCLHQEPHFIDIGIHAKADKETCKVTEFHELHGQNGNGTSYWVSLSKLSWIGANNCCQSKGLRSASPKSADELEDLAKSIRMGLTKLCAKDKMCGGFWTSTTTQEYLPHSPLRFPTGKLLTRALYSLIRADEFTYPSCGRINFMDLKKSEAKYMHADCLEKNFVLCEVGKKKKHNILERQLMDEFGDRNGDFEQSVFEKFFDPATVGDLELQKRNYRKDLCPTVDVQREYLESCPLSATEIDSDSKHSEPTAVSKIVIPFQNKHILLQQLLSSALYTNEETDDLQAYAFQFLKSSVTMFSKLCPVVPRSFLDNALEMFRRLHIVINPKSKPEIITNENFEWTLKLLGLCEDYLKPVNIKTDNCGDLILAENSCKNYVCTDAKFEFNFNNTDLLIDIVWKVFEAIHAVCFPAFKQNPMLHHKYAMVITDLWENEEVRLRWSCQLENKEFWRRLLGPHFDVHTLNMERCNTVLTANSYFHVRLPRASIPHSVRMKGFSYESLQSSH